MAAPSWHTWVENYIRHENIDKLADVIDGIQKNTISFLELVEFLGQYLTSTEVPIRCSSIQLLNEVISHQPSNGFNEKEAKVLSAYLESRLSDHYSLHTHVLHGITGLVLQKSFPDADAVKLAMCVLKDLQVQAMPQGDRNSVYSLILNLLNYRLEGLRESGGDFVFGFIQAMDGEKDPRNLMLCFQCVTFIAQNLSLGVFTEELFEVVACYFPIEFTPPPGDPNGVTKESLTIALRECLGASPKFAEFCMPLLLEKLTSTLLSAKLDALLTLNACAHTFGSVGIKEYVVSFWSNIRREVFAAINKQLEAVALETLKTITAVISTDINEKNKTSNLESFMSDIFKDCHPYIGDPEHQLMLPSSRLLCAAASASDPACVLVISKLLPLFFEKINLHPQAASKMVLFSALLSLMEVDRQLSARHEDSECALRPYKKKLHEEFVALTSSSSPRLRTQAGMGLVLLVSLPGMLDEAEKHAAAAMVAAQLVGSEEAVVRQEALEGLKKLSRASPSATINAVLPLLRDHLHRDTPLETSYQPAPQDMAVALTIISTNLEIVKATVPVIVQHIQQIQSNPPSENCHEQFLAVCQNLLSLVEDTIHLIGCTEYYRMYLVPECVLLCVQSAICPVPANTILSSQDVVVCISSIVRVVVQSLEARCAEELCHQMVELCLCGDRTLFGDIKLPDSIPFCPLKIESPWQQTQLVVLLSAVVCCMPSEVKIYKIPDLLEYLVCLSCECDHDDSALAAAKCYSGIINKMSQGSEVDLLISCTCERLNKVLDDNASSSINLQRSVQLWGWMTKALVLRAHPSQITYIDRLSAMLTIPLLGENAALGFQTVLSETENVMTLNAHANISPLYRQRLYHLSRDHVLHGFKTADTKGKKSCLQALAYLLQYVPQQVLTPDLEQLLPMLIQSLLCEDKDIWCSTMKTLQDLLCHSPEVLAKYVDDILPKLLELSKYKSKMDVRISATKCVHALIALPPTTLLPHQGTVVRGLLAAIDDPKRLVRKEAVKARSDWFLLGAPGGVK